MTTFTILTACYNGEPYIDDWFQSIVSQDHRPIQVVVCDDFSTDESVKKLKALSSPGIDLNIIQHDERRNYGKSLQTAFSKCTGQYAAVLDIDDALTDGSLSHVLWLYRQNPGIGHIYTQFNVCDENMNYLKVGHSRAPDRKESILSMGREKKIHVYSHLKTFLVTESSHLIFGDMKCCVDQWMGMILEQQYRGGFTNRVCYKYRSNLKTSLSHIHGTSRRANWYKQMKIIHNNRKENNIKYYPITPLFS